VRLDQYLEHLREIEGRIQRAEKQTTTELIAPRAPVGIPDSWEEHATTMFDLMALAFEADLTRVFTFMLNREASQLVFPDLGFNEPWHPRVASRQRAGEAGAAGEVEYLADRSLQPVREEAAVHL
jgi:hypothetical protein